MTGILACLIILIVGIVALCIWCYRHFEKSVAVGIIGILATIAGIIMLPSSAAQRYEDPDLPTGVKMKVVAGYVGVDSEPREVLQWQVGQKPDSEATVKSKALKIENNEWLDVGDTIIKLVNGTTIVLPAKEATADRTFH